MQIVEPRPGRKTDRRQAPREPVLELPIEIGKFWKSGRDRKNSIVIAIKQYEGHVFLDCRVFGTNSAGQSVPTAKGVTVGIRRIREFAGAVQKAVKKSVELGLIDDEAAS